MSANQSLRTKNLIELRAIKNFKTKKIKQRKKHHQWSLRSSLYFDQHHHPHLKCTPLPYFKCLRINQIIETSSSVSTSGSVFVQVASALQMSIILINCFKMYLIIVLFLSIIASHIANCQEFYARDNTILFFSNNHDKNNNLSEHILVNNINNKSLIDDSESKMIVTKSDVASTDMTTMSALSVIEIETNSDKLWSRRSYLTPGLEIINITPKINVSHRIYKKYQNNKNALLRNHLLNSSNSTYKFDADDNKQLLRIVMEGLNLQTLPDLKKANISQLEYSTKYNQYLDRLRKRAIPESDSMIFDQFDNEDDSNTSLSLLSIPHNSSETTFYRERRSPATGKDRDKIVPTKSILLRFPLELNSEVKASDIEEANIRLLLISNPALANTRQSKRRRHHHNRQNRLNVRKQNFSTNFSQKQNKSAINGDEKPKNKQQSQFLNMKVYQLLEPKGRAWIGEQKIEIKIDSNKMDETTSQWLQFDVTKAVEGWLVDKKLNLGLEIQCDNCFRNGARIIDDLSGDSEEDESSTPDKYDLAPVLNIIGRLGTHREKRSKHYHNQMTGTPKRNVRKSNCYKDNQRCCRHSMDVVFKEIKGFEFIIQPKVFDAGYCRGRCPPRYNPAHHHALLQSLIWKQDRKKVPRPCCAPSKLIELEVLHVDEKDNEKLKISTWTDMRVLECACS